MGNGDGIYEKWRANAARQAADDQFTVLFNEMVSAYRLSRAQPYPFEFGVYIGLRIAYCLLTGDDRAAVERQVENAAKRLQPDHASV